MSCHNSKHQKRISSIMQHSPMTLGVLSFVFALKLSLNATLNSRPFCLGSTSSGSLSKIEFSIRFLSSGHNTFACSHSLLTLSKTLHKTFSRSDTDRLRRSPPMSECCGDSPNSCDSHLEMTSHECVERSRARQVHTDTDYYRRVIT